MSEIGKMILPEEKPFETREFESPVPQDVILPADDSQDALLEQINQKLDLLLKAANLSE